MFRNERYTGIYKYKDIKIEGGVPAIISKEVFDRVQKRLQLNRQAPGRGKAQVRYLLSQKLFCGHCGSVMTGDCGTSQSGETYHYYTCSNRKRFRSCDKKNVRKEWIEQIVVEDALALLTDEHIEELADMAVHQTEVELSQNTIIPALKADIQDVERSITNLLKLAEKGADSSSLCNRLHELETQKKDLEKRLDTELKEIVVLEKDHIVWWLHKFSKGDINDPYFRSQVIDMLVNSVTIWDEPDGWYKITTVYNLTSQNTKTVRCSDFEAKGSPKKYRTTEPTVGTKEAVTGICSCNRCRFPCFVFPCFVF
jgi:hypothetical protein